MRKVNNKLKNIKTISVGYKDLLLINKNQQITKEQLKALDKLQQSKSKKSKINKKVSLIKTILKRKPKSVYESFGLADIRNKINQPKTSTNQTSTVCA